jgi:transposase
MPRKAWATQDNISERLMLEELYVVQLFTAEAVAEKLGWGKRTVYHRLAFHGLTPGNRKPRYCSYCGQVKPKSRAKALPAEKKKTKRKVVKERAIVNNSTNRRIWKTEDSLHESKRLRKLYIERNLTADEVAAKMGWSERTVYDRLHFHGLLPGYTAPDYCECCGQVINSV